MKAERNETGGEEARYLMIPRTTRLRTEDATFVFGLVCVARESREGNWTKSWDLRQ